jgi:hypothetical protein
MPFDITDKGLLLQGDRPTPDAAASPDRYSIHAQILRIVLHNFRAPLACLFALRRNKKETLRLFMRPVNTEVFATGHLSEVMAGAATCQGGGSASCPPIPACRYIRWH